MYYLISYSIILIIVAIRKGIDFVLGTCVIAVCMKSVGQRTAKQGRRSWVGRVGTCPSTFLLYLY